MPPPRKGGYVAWTELFHPVSQDDLAPHVVLNRGFGGARSCDLLAAMPELVLRHAPYAAAWMSLRGFDTFEVSAHI